MQQRSMLARAVPTLLSYNVAGLDAHEIGWIDEIIGAGLQSFEGRVEHLAIMLANRSKFNRTEFRRAVSEAERRYSEKASKKYRARYWIYRGDITQEVDEVPEQALYYYQEALLVWPHPDNEAKDKLQTLLAGLQTVPGLDPRLHELEWLTLPR